MKMEFINFFFDKSDKIFKFYETKDQIKLFIALKAIIKIISYISPSVGLYRSVLDTDQKLH